MIFNRGRGQSQGQSRGQVGNTYNRGQLRGGPWRGGQNYGRGQSENRGGRGNAGPGRGNFAATRDNRGGYGQNNNPKEMTLAGYGPKHMAQAAQFIQNHLGANQIIFQIKAVPDNLRQIARNRQLQQSTKYTDRKYPLKKGPKENPCVEHVGDDESVRCVLCGSTSHAMGFCLSLRDGELGGCSLCHDLGHLVDQCQTFLAMSLTNKVRTLVDDRTNMPPLTTSIPWWNYLHQWLEDDVSKNAGPPSGFPWSVGFTKKVNQRDWGAFVKGLQQEFDKDHNKRSILPVDADTNTFQSIYRKYWSSEQKSFPERIREVTGEVAPNDRSTDFSDYEMLPIPPDFDINAEPKGN
ncbi:hypothetical protein QYS62_003995 [Fusarium acuminatum]|uniref:Uncharacterized protein n=1 Tax=Fusarium acuminatum TaxID=5515 RepID=A0ABZ2WQI2_9HYPO